MVSVIDEYTTGEAQRQALECLYNHINGEKYHDATIDLALQNSEYPFQTLLPFEPIKRIVALLQFRPGEDDQVRLCLVSRVLKLPQVEESITNYKLHFAIGKALTEVDKLFFQFACTFYPHFKDIQAELLHLDFIAKATLAVKKTTEEEVNQLSKQIKEIISKDIPKPIAPPPPVPAPKPKVEPPKDEDVLDSAKKAITSLFSFKAPEQDDKLLDNVINAFQLMSKDQENVSKSEIATRDLQKAKIADMLYRIAKGYLPLALQTEQFTKVFKSFLEVVGETVFFSEPKLITSADKIKLDYILDKAALFLEMVNKRAEYMTANELTEETIDDKLLNQIIRIARKVKSKKLYNPQETVLEQLGLWIVSYVTLQVILNIFSPATFLNVIHRLLDQPIDLNTLEQNEPSLDFFKISDINGKTDPYVLMIGTKVKDIAAKVVGMGLTKPSPLINFIFSWLTPDMIGNKVTQIYARTLYSSCSMKPVLLAHHALLKDGKPILPVDKLPPTTIGERLLKDIYPLIKKKMDENAGFFSDMAAKISDLAPMLQTLGGNLQRIFEDPLTLKLLAHMILKEVDAKLTV